MLGTGRRHKQPEADRPCFIANKAAHANTVVIANTAVQPKQPPYTSSDKRGSLPNNDINVTEDKGAPAQCIQLTL